MKNKKGQLEMGSIIMVAITLIVGMILLVASAQNIHPTINTVEVVNQTFTLGAINTKLALTGQAVVGTPVVSNSTEIITSGNYTITSNDILNGVLTVTINATDAYIAGEKMNLTYTAQPDGYSTSSGARAVTGIIIVLFAVSIAVVALMPTVGSKIVESMGR